MNERRDPTLVGHIVLSRYRVLRRLARGGMGAVYLARTEGARGFTKPVVVKRILATVQDDDASSMFAREARILSLLQHPGIVSVLDFGQEDGGDLVMVLDYVHGYHLGYFQRYLQKVHGGVPYEMALYMMLRVLEALQYAHSFRRPDGTPMQIVHRDVSPANILLDVNGHLKLVDFGIARAQGDEDEYQTQTPRLKGKFAYLPLEIFKGGEPTVQADVYACGVVLYELLTGDNPFRGRELTDSYDKVLNVVATPVSSLRADVSTSLDAVVAKAIARDPQQRYASAQDFAQALRALRSISDEQGRAMLHAEVEHAFAGALASELGIEPLSVRDTAWRAGTETDESLRSVSTMPPPGPDDTLTEIERDMPTRATGPMAQAEWGEPPHDPHADQLGTHEAPTVALSPKAVAEITGTTQSLAPQPGPPSTQRWLFAALAGAALLGGTLVLTRGRDAAPERIVVIERQASPAAAPATPTPPAPALPTPPANRAAGAAPQEPARAEPTARAPKEHIAHAESSAADPKALTRAFARQQSHIEECFQLHATALPEQPGLAIDFEVGSDGSVQSARLSPATLANTPLGTCLLGVAKATRFPKLHEPLSFKIPLVARRVPAH
ncbi:MAG TPA: protein kinase [Polyangiales bacterium]